MLIRRAFKIVNLEDSESIDSKALCIAMRVLGFRAQSNDIDKMITHIDDNLGDGSITFDDFVKLMSYKMRKRKFHGSVLLDGLASTTKALSALFEPSSSSSASTTKARSVLLDGLASKM